ncbi:MAG: DUF4981 domain-containing protein, partial [Caldilineaceae bacterium]|nr:DUF4981 domain-containing protein [Caldilineaceae bacterium]
LRVTNRHHFADLSYLHLSWELTVDGRVLQSGVLPALDTAPGDTSEIRVPFETPPAIPGADYWLTVRFTLRDAIDRLGPTRATRWRGARCRCPWPCPTHRRWPSATWAHSRWPRAATASP